MWLPVLFITMAVGCLGDSRSIGNPRRDPNIVGGEEVSIEKIPYQLGLEIHGFFICAGSIISEYWALTAAHCLNNQEAKDVRMRSGSSIYQEGGELHQAVELIYHEKYDYKITDYDVGLVRVDTPFNKSHIIGLATIKPPVGTNTTVSGWGRTHEGGTGSKTLRWVHVPVVDQVECVALNAAVNITVTDRMFCAGYKEGGKDACGGDSGGPLAVGNVVTGIVSTGYGCARKSHGIYTDVAVVHKWIVEKTGIPL